MSRPKLQARRKPDISACRTCGEIAPMFTIWRGLCVVGQGLSASFGALAGALVTRAAKTSLLLAVGELEGRLADVEVSEFARLEPPSHRPTALGRRVVAVGFQVSQRVLVYGVRINFDNVLWRSAIFAEECTREAVNFLALYFDCLALVVLGIGTQVEDGLLGTQYVASHHDDADSDCQTALSWRVEAERGEISEHEFLPLAHRTMSARIIEIDPTQIQVREPGTNG
jgi:hypothetical protein